MRDATKRLSRGREAVCLLQIQHAESYANLICVRLRMFITCKEIPWRTLSVFSQERQRVAFRSEVCEAEERKKREKRTVKLGGDEGKQKKRHITLQNFARVSEALFQFLFFPLL